MYKKDGRRTLLVIIVVILVFVATACQATPETAVVSSKTTDIEDVVANSDAESAQTNEEYGESTKTTYYETPETYTNEFSQANVQVYVDAKIYGPEDNKIESVVLEDTDVNQDMVDDFLNYFIGDSQLYEKTDNRQTKAQASEEILYWKEAVFNAQNKWDEVRLKDPYAVHDNSVDAVKEFEQYIEQLEREMADAPDAAGYTEISRELTGEHLVAYAQTTGGSFDDMAYIVIFDAEDSIGGYIGTMMYESMGEMSESSLTEAEVAAQTGLTLESAMEQAAKAARDFGVEELYLEDYMIYTHVKAGQTYPCYTLNLTPATNGIGMPGLSDDTQLAFGVGELSPAPRPEKFRIYVDETGIIHFSWDSPKTVVKELDENVEIMDFDQVIETFEQKILYTLYMEGDEQREIHINTISLSLMPVKKQDSTQTVTVPVWDFRGYYFDPNDEVWKNSAAAMGESGSNYSSFLTINAIDGSIISRHLGY